MLSKFSRILLMASVISVGGFYSLEATETIQLKDGRIILGEIVERNLDGVIVVRLEDGSNIWFYESDIRKIEKAKSPTSNYNLFKPIPKSNLQPMESDILALTPGPRTVDAGHSILQLESRASFSPFDYNKTQYSQYLRSYDNELSFKVGINKHLEFGIKLTFSPIYEYTFDLIYDYDYSNGVISHVVNMPETLSDYISSLQLQSKINLNVNVKDIFQISILPILGFEVGTLLYASVGIPAEIHFSEKLSLNFYLNFYFCSTEVPGSEKITIDPKSISPYSRPINPYSYDFTLFFKNTHTFAINWRPSTNVNIFSEIAGSFSSIPNRKWHPYEIYSMKFNSGIRFTFFNSFQLALAVKVGLFDDPEKIGGGAGVAVRF